MLKIQNLSVNYSTRSVLKNISLEVKKGEILALLGPNGSGKSTLLRTICGILPANHGSILLAGHPLIKLNPAERARWVSVVPQNSSLPPIYTAWETVLLGRTPYINFLGQVSARDETIARCALERVDALSLAERNIGELSGGEQQRVLLARALAQSAPILLLDEPTTYLDLQHQMSMLNLVQKLSREDGITVIVALHDLNLAARFADRIALLVDGQLKAVGTTKQVLQADVIAEAYRWPVQVVNHPFLDTPLILPDVSI
ncbi:MAG TPA: heme ABC transporter ATP-binding protein [Anaerolineales bacterium]|jgi:iron complex transport system ATP-binding protein